MNEKDVLELLQNHPDAFPMGDYSEDRRIQQITSKHVREGIAARRKSLMEKVHYGGSISFEQPQDKFIIDGWLPEARVSILTGSGAAGKTTLNCAIAASVALNEDVGILPGMYINPTESPRPVVYVTYEETPQTIMARIGCFLQSRFVEQMHERQWRDRLVIVDAASEEAFYISSRQGQTWTWTGHAVLDWAADIEPRLMIIDPLAAAYSANENDRPEVRGFVGYMNHWARAADCAVLLTMHPPKNRAVYSGSTDWRNAARAMISLEALPPDPWEAFGDRYVKFEEQLRQAIKAGRTLAMLRVEKMNNARKGRSSIVEITCNPGNTGLLSRPVLSEFSQIESGNMAKPYKKDSPNTARDRGITREDLRDMGYTDD